MASPSTMTVTVDRISNSGNAIAQEQVNGADIHVPATAEVGSTLEVELVKVGSYFKAKLVDGAEGLQQTGPSISPDTSEIGQRILNREKNNSYDFSTGKSVTSVSADEELRKLSRRKK